MHAMVAPPPRAVSSSPFVLRWTVTAPQLTLALLLHSAMLGSAFPTAASRPLVRSAASARSVARSIFPPEPQRRERWDDRRPPHPRQPRGPPHPQHPGRGLGRDQRRMPHNGNGGPPQQVQGTNEPFTVQDRLRQGGPAPVFNGVNPDYPGLRVLSSDPPVFAVDDFLSPAECDFLIHAASDALQTAPVVGRGGGEVSQARTSSTCFLAREDLPEYVAKVSALTGKPPGHCELPQVGRYLQSQHYQQHYDAFDLGTDDGRRVASKGGQRTVTVLVYLNDVENGGETAFPELKLAVKPKRGKAVVFFPATVDGYLDQRVLHAATPAVDVKYVSQVWIRQGAHDGVPSKRLGPEFRAAAPAVWEVPQQPMMGNRR
eukprot:CAMPEP_0113540950 /NCGR_PEP_ID=MMETSP0015_2-20120614/8759_1 /TAXON_ID=2838 /ORGANISM="Odontella" /LENGTH=372 /DNA_ID=CAMNT_0000440799 /DNA_START=341 /DNA_END=1459 /DNA_ORIENTATION=- /assembly_acc=CAM_ASM_000160